MGVLQLDACAFGTATVLLVVCRDSRQDERPRRERDRYEEAGRDQRAASKHVEDDEEHKPSRSELPAGDWLALSLQMPSTRSLICMYGHTLWDTLIDTLTHTETDTNILTHEYGEHESQEFLRLRSLGGLFP